MMKISCTTAILRFPRRNPLSLLILLIPLALLLYTYFEPLSEWRTNRINFDSALSSTPTPAISNDTSQILLVSAYFPISLSKLTLQADTEALKRFLGQIKTDVYIFTPPDLASTVQNVRGAYPITINTTFATPFSIPPLQDLEVQYTEMRSKGHSRTVRNVDLYALRSGRPFYLAEAVRNVKEKEYKYAFWVDANSFTSPHAYEAWPDLERADQIWDEGRRESGSRPENLIFFQIRDLPHVSMLLWKENMGPIENTFSQTAFFGGPLKTIAWWEKYFYAYHDFYLSAHNFMGHDEALVNSLFLMRPDRVMAVWPSDPQAPARVEGAQPGPTILGDCGDLQSYYQFWFAGNGERDLMRAMWDGHWSLRWDWWKPRTSCRVTGVLAMEWLLRRPFGGSWYHPESSIKIPG